MSERSEAATPLTERLRSVPRGERLTFSPPDMPPSAMAVSVVPIGEYMHEAAAEVDRLRELLTETERLHEIK